MHVERETYSEKGLGFTLQHIDGLHLCVYKYTLMDGSSYILLPQDITNKKAVINPQNTDQECFKWTIMAKYVMGYNKNRVRINYSNEEYPYTLPV